MIDYLTAEHGLTAEEAYVLCSVAGDLKRYLEGRPIAARQITQFERGWRWCKRNPVVSALAVAVLVAGVGLLMISRLRYRSFKELDLRNRRLLVQSKNL